MRKILLGLAAVTLICSATLAQKKSKKNNSLLEESKGAKTIEKFTSGMQLSSGFFDYYFDDSKDKIYLVVNRVDVEFLYVNALASGVGSNDIGLDRGQLGSDRVVKFEKHGRKLLLTQPNYKYRAVSENMDEVKSVQEAFASSVLWGFPIVAETGDRYLIDLSDFLLRDSHNVKGRLSRSNQGSYQLDKSRSALYLDNTMNFPMNTEFESVITLTGTPKGWYIRSVTPSAEAVTVRTHHSFIQLPDDNYTPRKFDPRSGFGSMSYQDYATPIESPLVKRFIVRHRLEKKNPDQEVSEAIEPIIYYLDRGAPEPVRSALLDGARWWNDAFAAAGFKDAFQVKMLPEGAHPLDVRYNMIQWVHRSTRGWSYGSSIVDPRTGEILKGHVSLGSLRVRQDFLIAQGLLNQYDDGIEPMKELALARLRQLSAHEVGHTIGLSHNYAASTSDRASVMDYPHPQVRLDANGEIDLSDAYDVGIGDWDKVAIQFGYSTFTQNEAAGLEKILADSREEGLLFISDRDSRPRDGAHPLAHLWDNGKTAAGELNDMMKIRRKVLDNLSERSLPSGEPYSSLEEIMVPMYLFHRYQIEAASKVVGGMNYTFAVKGDGQIITEFVPAEDQMEALDALISTMQPKALMLSESLLSQIPPKAHGYSRGRESFSSKTGPVFDYYSAIETAVQMPLMFILNTHRANRLVMFNDRNPSQPGLQAVLDRLIDKTWKSPSNSNQERAIQRIAEWVMLEHLMMNVVSSEAQPDVKSINRATLKSLSGYVKSVRTTNLKDKAHYERVSSTIDFWLTDPTKVEFSDPVKAPDGSPIGMDLDFLRFCSFDY